MKFKVKVQRTIEALETAEIEIEATNAEHAKDKARLVLNDNAKGDHYLDWEHEEYCDLLSDGVIDVEGARPNEGGAS